MDEVDVINERWDYLIVLDACRFDFFAETYRDYLDGVLMMKKSLGTSTNEWRDKCFPGYYDDIIYISANPQICDKSAVYGYTAGEHFGTVHELWKDHWDRELGTVRPEVVTRLASEIIRATPGKRFIIHYLQPHAPYLSLADRTRGYLDGDVNSVRRLIGTEAGQGPGRVRKKLFQILRKALPRGGCRGLLPKQPEWMLRKLLAIAPKAPLEAAWRTVGRQGVRAAYAANLEAVLQQTAELVRSLSGRIVVTSDHGEFLGEDGFYGHPTGSDHPILKEVPWLVVEGAVGTIEREGFEYGGVEGQKTPAGEPQGQEEQEELRKKLQALGYYD